MIYVSILACMPASAGFRSLVMPLESPLGLLRAPCYLDLIACLQPANVPSVCACHGLQVPRLARTSLAKPCPLGPWGTRSRRSAAGTWRLQCRCVWVCVGVWVCGGVGASFCIPCTSHIVMP